MCHRYNVKYDVFYAKVLQCPPLHSVDAGCLAVEQLGGRTTTTNSIIDSFLVYIMADPSPGDVLHEKRPGADLLDRVKYCGSFAFFSFYLPPMIAR